MTYYKVTDEHGNAINGGTFTYSLPTETGPGEWTPFIADIEPCATGYHVCDGAGQLLHWLSTTTLWEAEIKPGDEVVNAGTKTVAHQVRLVKRVATWNGRTARLFAADCAEHVLYLFEGKYPDDKRPRQAIQAARDYANGLISKTALRDAAYAYAAAYADAYAERTWQTALLQRYLDGDI